MLSALLANGKHASKTHEQMNDSQRVSRHLAVYLAPSYHMAELIDVSKRVSLAL